MAKRQGKGGEFEVAGNKVAELRSWSFSEEPESVTGAAMQDNNVATRYGAIALTGELTFFDDDTDTNGQGAISSGGSASTCKLFPEGDASGNEVIEFSNVQWGPVQRTGEQSGWIEKTVTFAADSKSESTVA